MAREQVESRSETARPGRERENRRRNQSGYRRRGSETRPTALARRNAVRTHHAFRASQKGKMDPIPRRPEVIVIGIRSVTVRSSRAEDPRFRGSDWLLVFGAARPSQTAGAPSIPAAISRHELQNRQCGMESRVFLPFGVLVGSTALLILAFPRFFVDDMGAL